MPQAQGRAGAAIFCFSWLKKSWMGFFNSLLDRPEMAHVIEQICYVNIKV